MSLVGSNSDSYQYLSNITQKKIMLLKCIPTAFSCLVVRKLSETAVVRVFLSGANMMKVNALRGQRLVQVVFDFLIHCIYRRVLVLSVYVHNYNEHQTGGILSTSLCKIYAANINTQKYRVIMALCGL